MITCERLMFTAKLRVRGRPLKRPAIKFKFAKIYFFMLYVMPIFKADLPK